MIVSLIAAMDEEGGIGKNGRVPWHLSDDLKRFKRLTMGHHILMGRKTYESIGKLLPGRISVVITRSSSSLLEGCIVVGSLKEAFQTAEKAGETEAFVIGGGQIFKQAIGLAHTLYLTRVYARLGCDVFFPAYDGQEWMVEEQAFQPQDDHNQYPSTFLKLVHLP